MILKKLMMFVFCFSLTFCAISANAAVRNGKTTVIFFGNQPVDEFDKKVKPLFRQRVGSCNSCEILDMTPYDQNGKANISFLVEKIESIPKDTSFVYFGFNMKVSEGNKKIIEALNKKVEEGLLVVGTAGTPAEAESSGPLSRTMLGQVRGAVIIGELGERDRLPPTGFYGPEMLTAVRPPKDILGQGFAPLIFAAALAQNWPKREPQDWLDFLKTKKMTTRKIWLEMGDVF